MSLGILKSGLLSILLLAGLTGCSQTAAKPEPGGYAGKAQGFIDDMVERHGFDRDTLTTLFGQAQRRDDILELMSKPAEKKLRWYEYRRIFLTQGRIQGGVRFWQANADALEMASQAYGIDPQIIVAIIGVETRYGSNTGRHRVLDALSTLAFDYPPRSDFFRGELEEYLVLAREEDIDLLATTGSYAGAMGYGQFIPSSYRSFAVDFDADGKRDLWNSKMDIIGSVANYFHAHGWEPDAPVTTRASVTGNEPDTLLEGGYKPNMPLAAMRRAGVEADAQLPDDLAAALFRLEQEDGPEYWVGFNNFYVITRYNHSPLYAMAVYQLSEEIRAAYEQEQH
ncbi:MAG: lytic murein transglycosylase B [Gammaproteobacteria bacterium]|jgi:membrane-bound lytic murein transglycosylase B